MADPYEAYRLPSQTPANPWLLQGSPQGYGAPSSSLWGNYLDRSSMGLGAGQGMDEIAGLSMAGANATLPLAGIFGPGLATGIYKDIFRADNPLKAAGDLDTWRNIGSFGSYGAGKEQKAAEDARRSALLQWRMNEGTRLGGLLEQQGSDVAGDLRGELEAALAAGGDSGNMDAVRNALSQFETRANQYMLRRGQAGQARQVDAMFADPRRAADRNTRLGLERTRAMGDLAEQYRMGQRNNAFNQARRGMQGSSVDVEQQGQMQRGRDRAAGGIQAGLDEKARAYRLGDATQQNTLKGLIYADDPNMAAGFQRSLESIGAQGKLVQEGAAARSQASALNSATSQGYSQAFGGLLTGLSQPLGYYIEHQGGGA